MTQQEIDDILMKISQMKSQNEILLKSNKNLQNEIHSRKA